MVNPSIDHSNGGSGLRSELHEPPRATPKPGCQPARVRKLRDAQWADLDQRFQSGETITALAKQFNVHRTSIQAHFDRRGIPRSPTPCKLTDQLVSEARTLYREGSSTETIGNHFGVNANTIATALRRVDVPLRPRRGAKSSGSSNG